MNKFFALTAALYVMLSVGGCQSFKSQDEEILLEPEYSVDVFYPLGENAIRTPDGANALDLETPLRCNVNWQTQQIVLTYPFNNSAFRLVRLGRNDPLPRFEVTGFTFETMAAEKALYQLTKEADIKLVAKDAPYASLSGENLRGEFADIVDMITQTADMFYTYDDDNKVMTLSRKVEVLLYLPPSRPILLAVLDVLRGAGITSMIANWEEYSIQFDADMEVYNKILDLIDYFAGRPTLIAYDVGVFKILPNDGCDIQWKELLDAFEFGTITTAQTGVIGRILTTTNDLSLEKLESFLGRNAKIVPVAEGKFMVPDQWMSRFDIGKCGMMKCAESDLSILTKAEIGQDNRISSEVTLETLQGQITRFKVRNKLGENFMIIGLPNQLFGTSEPRSETVVFMVPRLIRPMETTEIIKNNL